MPEHKISYYIGLAAEMRRQDHARDELHQAMEDQHHLQWDLPKSIANLEWVRKFISTDPFDALNSLTRILSTVRPSLTLQPLAPNPETKALANKIEKALSWHLASAGRRGRAKIVRDIVLSAARHDEVCAQVVMLDVQAGLVGMSKKRQRAARRFGPFAVLVRNPRFVHSRYSDWMLENVVHCHVVKAQEAVDFWGERAKPIADLIATDPVGTQYVTLYDYWDLDVHTVWAYPSDMDNLVDATLQADQTGSNVGGLGAGAPIVILPPTEHGLSFIPWVVRVGGTNLDDKPEFQRYPLLYSVYRAGQWVTQNIIGSLVNSEGMAYAAAPRIATYSPDPNNPPGVNYGDTGRSVDLRMGMEEVKPLAPPTIDAGLLAIADRIGASINKSTVSAVLQTGEFPAGAAYATLNLVTQNAVKAISPFRVLSEVSIADIATMMLYWVDYTKEPLIALGAGKADLGSQYIIHPDDFDVDNLYIEAMLTPDVPTDRLGRINAAAIAVERLGMSRERGLEEAGVEDPQTEMGQAMYEALLQNEITIAIQSAQARAQMQLQMMQQQMQQQIMMQQQQQMQAQQMQTGLPNQQPMQPQAPGIPGGGGPGFNPSLGGQPAQMMQPGATREMQRGSAQGGLPNATQESAL